MATLEKIRSKSVLLIVIIGIALLAFIVGDALTNSRNLFGSGNTVAKIGGEKIDITEYQQKREELSNRLEELRKQNPQQYANFDNQLLAQMAIDELIMEKLIDDAVDQLGIKVTGDQLRFYVIDSPINPKMNQLISAMQQNGVNVQSPSQAYEIIFNPKRNGLTDKDVEGYRSFWLAIENETKTLIARQTYQRLLSSTIKANELDKKALHNDYITTSQLMVAFTPYGNLDEKKYPVSDAEIKAQYDKEKNRFRVTEPTKSVSLIAVNVAPSQADRQKSSEIAKQVVKQLSDSAGQLDKKLKKEVSMTRREARLSDLPGTLKDTIARLQPGQVAVISENIQGFNIVRMGKRSSVLDSIQLNIVQVAGSKLPNSVLAALNGGLAADSLSTKFSADSVGVQKEQWIPLFANGQRTMALDEAQVDSLVNANGKYITLMSQNQGAVLAALIDKKAPKEVYEFEEVTYQLQPSTQTLNTEREKLEKFLAANNTAEKFNSNAQKAGFTIQNMELTQSSPALPSQMGLYPDSRQVVRWVMIEGKPGEVSHIYESKDAMRPMLFAVAVNAEYDDFTPVTEKAVKDYVSGKVRRAKAGDAMVKKFSAAGTSIDQIAKAMGVEPSEVADFRFGRNGKVRDAAVIGKIAGTKPGTKVIVVKGDDGVYAVAVNGNKTESFEYNDRKYSDQYLQGLNLDFQKMLRSGKKFNNNAYKFEAGD